MDDLLKSAFVGTATHAPPLVADHPADVVTPEVNNDAERNVLLRAGARAVWRSAGYRPVRDVAAVTPAPSETLPALSDRAASLLRAAFASNVPGLLNDLLEQTRAAGLRLPPALLPEALSLIARPKEVLLSLRNVIGERGRWLARLNPDWIWAASEAADSADREALRRQWEEGSTAERLEALIALRSADAAEGRAWLEQALPNEKADIRSRLVDALATGLTADDEALLEQSLSDRSEAVRSAAARLLARLPGSALVSRMTVRADGILAASRGGMLRRTLQLTCTPPEQLEKDWLRDGIPKEPSISGIGPRATWTEAVLACVPLSHWTARFEASPADLVKAAQADEYGDSILAGWSRATSLDPTNAAEWSPLLVDYWFEMLKAAETSSKQPDRQRQMRAQTRLQETFPALSQPAVESFLKRHLCSGGRDSQVVVGLLGLLQAPWSRELTSEWLKGVVAAFKSKAERPDWAWEQSLAVATTAVPLPSIDEVVRALDPVLGDLERPLYGPTRNAFEAFRLRGEFHRAVQEQLAGMRSDA